MPVDTGSDLTNSNLEIELLIPRAAYPLAAVPGCDECVFELAAILPRPDGRYAEFLTVSGVDAARIEADVADREDVDVSVLREYETGGLIEVLGSGDRPATRLAELGATPRQVLGNRREIRIVADVSPRYDPSTIIEAFLADFPDARLGSKRERRSSTPLFVRPAFYEAMYERLTDRQREVLRVAFEAGYYEWPRRSTGEEVAAMLGISSATFSEHVHAAERRLLAVAFEGPDADGPGHR